jgi:large subunit ribosomal protein L28
MQLKREMLIRLAKRETDLYPNDAEKQAEIYARYKELAVPLEEAEWVGLMPWEAMTKQKNIEENKMRASIRPLKEVFAEQELERLRRIQAGENIEEEQVEKKPAE